MGEINVWGNVHIFGEQPPLIVYGAVLNVHRTRREVCYCALCKVTILTFDLDCACRYVVFDHKQSTSLNGVTSSSNVHRF